MDTTVREVLQDRTLRELTKASGGAWGGAKVNLEFFDFIQNIVGKDVMQTLRKEHHSESLDFDKEIEQKKRCLETDNQKRLVIKLPAIILEKFEELNGVKLSEHIKRSKWGNSMDLKNDKLRISYKVFATLFAPSIESIVQHTRDILSNPVCAGMKDIILVGGFADSKIISTTLKQTFNDYRVIIPREAGLAVLRGAVIYGLTPNVVSERVARYTYGTSQYRYFMKGDPTERKRKIDGKFYCKGVFNKLAGMGQTFRVGQRVETPVFPLTADMTQMPVSFYKTIHDPEFTDNSCQLVGNILVDMSDTSGGMERMVMVSLEFGDTELRAEGINSLTGESVEVVLDLLTQR